MNREQLIDQLFKNAEETVNVFNNLPEILTDLGFNVPKCYDPSRRGGIMKAGFGMNDYEIKQIGKIINKPDPEFENKLNKYTAYAKGKYSVLVSLKVFLSEQGKFKPAFNGQPIGEFISIAGGVAFEWNNGYVFTAFSGRASQADQAILIMAAYKTGIVDKKGIEVYYQITSNPYLEANLFGALISEMK
ncbi:MAG TPA: hypothetical protein P5060_01765 [Candidatus Absconditabacterales bacterium]|nr:hypothetical protein [Candidatus Absconditabacterales bacterium]